MRKTDIAYAAGFFDGEGAIGIRLQKQKYLRVEVSASQNTLEVLYWMQRYFGGSVYQGRVCSQWKLFGEKAVGFLKIVTPYLIVKQYDAVEAMGAWEARHDLDRIVEMVRLRKERYDARRSYSIAVRARHTVWGGVASDRPNNESRGTLADQTHNDPTGSVL